MSCRSAGRFHERLLEMDATSWVWNYARVGGFGIHLFRILPRTDLMITYSSHPFSSMLGKNIQIQKPLAIVHIGLIVVRITDLFQRVLFFSLDQCKTSFVRSQPSKQPLPFRAAKSLILIKHINSNVKNSRNSKKSFILNVNLRHIICAKKMWRYF